MLNNKMQSKTPNEEYSDILLLDSNITKKESKIFNGNFKKIITFDINSDRMLTKKKISHIVSDDFIDNYNMIRNEITKYGKNLIEKKELIAFSKSDLISEDKKKLSEIIEKKIGKKPFIFSNISNDGIEDLVMALFEQCLNSND